MSKNYTVTLTDVEDLAFSYVSTDPQYWVDNVVQDRCRRAIEDIVQIAIKECFATNTPVPATQDELVTLAFSERWVKTAVQVQQELEAARAAAEQQSAE